MAETHPTHPRWHECAAEIRCPQRRPELRENWVDDECVLFDPVSGETFRLNETAAFVWRACDPAATTRDVAELLAAAYEIGPEQALADVEQLLVFFAEYGLLTDTEAA